MKWDFHPEALEEYREAALSYAERDPTLALKFLDTVEDAIRCCLTHVFPYAVLFTIEPESILIVAVMHCSREPGYWKRRVPQS